MFILIAPVGRFSFNEPFDWGKMKRESAICNALIERHEKNTETSGLKPNDFQECLIEENGRTLSVTILENNYPKSGRPIDRLAEDLNNLSDKIKSGEVEFESITIDFYRVDFMNSMVIGNLLNLKKAVEAKGGKLNLVNLKPDLSRMFNLLQLGTFFNIK